MTRRDAVRRAYLQLRDMIVGGAIAPGSPLIERSVAEAVDASRSTVRTALQQLEQEGFVTVSSIGSHYSRFSVKPLTIDDMCEWYHMFGALDGIAARGAAGLPVDRRSEVARSARRIAEAHYEAGSGVEPKYQRIQALDSQFHNSYVQVGGGAVTAASVRDHAPTRGSVRDLLRHRPHSRAPLRGSERASRYCRGDRGGGCGSCGAGGRDQLAQRRRAIRRRYARMGRTRSLGGDLSGRVTRPVRWMRTTRCRSEGMA